MKKLLALMQIVCLVALSPIAILAQNQNTKIGSIQGVVVDKEEKDKDKKDDKRTLELDIKSDIPFDKIQWNKVGDLKIVEKALPDDWDVKKEGDKIIISGETPTRHFQGGFEVPQDSRKKLDDIIKKGISFDYSFGSTNYGLRPVEIKKGEPTNPANPNDAAEIPDTVRVGNAFTIKAKEGFTDGKWKIGIGDKWFEEYREPASKIDANRFVSDFGEFTIKEDVVEKIFNQLPPTVNGNPNPLRTFFIPDGTPIPPELKMGLTYDSPFGERKVNGTAKTTVLPDFPETNGLPYLPPPRLINCAPKVFENQRLCVCGFFPNLFSQGRLLVDGKSLGRPVSATTDTVSFYPQGLAPGRHVITWDMIEFDSPSDPEIQRENPSSSEKVEFVVLQVQASIDSNKLFTGEGTTLRFNIIGTDEKVPVQLTNATPAVIQMEGGVVVTSGGTDGNGFTRPVKGIKRGNFDIQYTLATPPCPCNPADTERAAQGIGGEVKDTSTKPPDKQPNDQPKEKPKNCEQVLAGCKEIANELAQLERDYNAALRYGESENSSLGGAEREAAIKKMKDDAKKIYEPAIQKARTKLAACLKVNDNCKAGTEESFDSADFILISSDASKEQPQQPEKDPCEELEKQLQARLEQLLKEYQKTIEGCEKFSSDPERAKNCQLIAQQLFFAALELAKSAPERCRYNLNPQKYKDDLAKECEDLETEFGKIAAEQAKAIDDCPGEKGSQELQDCLARVRSKYKVDGGSVEIRLKECKAKKERLRKFFQ